MQKALVYHGGMGRSLKKKATQFVDLLKVVFVGGEGEFPPNWSDPKTTAQLFPISHSPHATAKPFPLTGVTYKYHPGPIV